MADSGGEWSSWDASRGSGREKPRHGETRLGGACEIAIVRRHHTEHLGGPAVITSHNARCIVGAAKAVLYSFLEILHDFEIDELELLKLNDITRDFHCHKAYMSLTEQQQQPPFNGLCSGTTRVGWYQKKDSAFCLSIGLCCV